MARAIRNTQGHEQAGVRVERGQAESRDGTHGAGVEGTYIGGAEGRGTCMGLALELWAPHKDILVDQASALSRLRHPSILGEQYALLRVRA